MTGADIIKEVQENASEWLETVDEPRDLLVAILANKLSTALSYIDYLEKRLKYVSANTRY